MSNYSKLNCSVCSGEYYILIQGKNDVPVCKTCRDTRKQVTYLGAERIYDSGFYNALNRYPETMEEKLIRELVLEVAGFRRRPQETN